jgi:hypothetical protein
MFVSLYSIHVVQTCSVNAHQLFYSMFMMMIELQASGIFIVHIFVKPQFFSCVENKERSGIVDGKGTLLSFTLILRITLCMLIKFQYYSML